MSAIKHAIDRVLLTIPKDILKLAFMKKPEIYRIETTLEQQINDLIIDKIVLTDINLIGGITITIPVNKCFTYTYGHEDGTTSKIIKVPPTLLNNKKIITPLSLMVSKTTHVKHMSNNTGLLDLTKAKLNFDNNSNNIITTSNLELISTNTILINEDLFTLSNATMEVTVENNRNLNNIKPANRLIFTKLVILAVKAFIFNSLVLELDKGSLYYGHELSRLGDIVNSYEEAYNDYQLMLKEKWMKISFMNDSKAMDDFINLSISPV